MKNFTGFPLMFIIGLILMLTVSMQMTVYYVVIWGLVAMGYSMK